MSIRILALCMVTFWATLTGCKPVGPQADGSTEKSEFNKKIETNDTTELIFSISLDPQVYEETDWGLPPQFALWLENPDTGKIRTVWVTHRTGTGDWVGKIECTVAIPYWVSRYNREKSTVGPPTHFDPLPDALTGATPKQNFTAQIKVPHGSNWTYYIEVNVSGDFNASFPSVLPDGTPDMDGNGQPSLIYQGKINAVAGSRNTPVLIGRTDQWEPVDKVITDLTGIDTAKQIFSKIEASCLSAN